MRHSWGWRCSFGLLFGLVASCTSVPVQELALTDMLPTADVDPTRDAPAHRIFFELDSAELTPDAMAILDSVAADPARPTWKQILLAGHADRIGSERDNVRLSASRAEAVRRHLVAAGISETMITTAVRGERDGLVETPDGMAEPQNRRVELYIRDR